MGNRLETLIEKIRTNPKGVRFADLKKLCDTYFGEPRQTTGSHRVYKMPWAEVIPESIYKITKARQKLTR